MVNLLIKIQYDGSNYNGWQLQPRGKTIQGEIEKAISIITRENIRVEGSGRTDAGVHALGQYCNFHTTTKISESRIPGALNGNLPRDIRVTNCWRVKDAFNARYDTIGKCYYYNIDNNRTYNPTMRKFAHHVAKELDIPLMVSASKGLIGKHDFKGFMNAGSSIRSTIRTINDLSITKKDEIIRITISADGFLYNMVRIIAGTLIRIGKGKIHPQTIEEMLITGQRRLGGSTAPPQGLHLFDVYYLDIEKSL